ncbi:heat shock 70 kDa protein 12B-like [Mercenaria mercenaria]|uniref:heat shock 70 kDa protein 12B-like n=1 Tax=Mercenaria mercenaria TaxID=6596 RepID=UPI001E1DE78E|nr:heat shock 70 kDa protein 12B-like [Mercenaria mercenaria]
MATNCPSPADKGIEPQLVIGIDFGTTGSGYAFQTRADFKSDRLRIYENLQWGRAKTQYKTPTCLLVNPERTDSWFGDEAEQEYIKLRPRDQPNNWFFFRNFKMQIYGKEITTDMVLTSENGNELPALFVFSESIKWMRNHVLTYLERTNCRYLEQMTKWVLTVPAIWTEGAKQLMRKAAQRAGIQRQNLCIALEPEVAAVYCTTAEANPPDDPRRDFDRTLPSGPGTTNMIVDMGGGTVDITTIQVKKDGTMKQIHMAAGGPAGGNKVDEKFFRFLSDILGASVWRKFCQDFPVEFYDFRMSFETSKRNLLPKLRHNRTRDEFPIFIPGTIIQEFEREQEKDIATALRQNEMTRDKVEFEFGKLIFRGEILRQMMNSSLEEIIGYVTHVAKEVKALGRPIHAAILVGGFASSDFMNDEMKSIIQERLGILVKRPTHCEMAVLRGAVLFGHNENILTSRVVRMTYGIGVTMPYSSKYPKDKKFTMDGNAYVSGVFAPHVFRGQEVKIDEWISANEYYPLEQNQKEVVIYVFASESKDTKLTDEEDCKCIGKFEVSFGEGRRGILLNSASTEISFNFGRTELIIRAKDTKTGNEVYESLTLK